MVLSLFVVFLKIVVFWATILTECQWIFEGCFAIWIDIFNCIIAFRVLGLYEWFFVSLYFVSLYDTVVCVNVILITILNRA